MIKTINIDIKPYSYDVYVGQKLNLATFFNPYKDNKIFIITDKNVYNLYRPYIENEIQDYQLQWVIIKPGERSKSFKTYQQTINKLLEKGIQRKDVIIGFGGGVVGDLAGFIAGTLFRGLRYLSIPTTLLAMTDSSIGGKTGIDLTFGKNLVGVFKQPLSVIIDTYFLETLPEIEFNNGMAEIIKAGFLKDEKLINLLKEKDLNLLEIIIKAIEVKRQIVVSDPYEKQERMLLNFGHSFGHAIEQFHNYKIKHGYAVSMGMDLALQFGILNNWTKKEILEPFYNLIYKFGLPSFSGDVNLYIKQLDYDKKSDNDYINFIIIKDIGTPEIKRIKKETLYELTRTSI